MSTNTLPEAAQVMPPTKKSAEKSPSPRLDVDRRVAIALEALSGVERRRVESTLRDPSSFAPKQPASQSPPIIHALNPDGSLLVRAVDPSLRLVFSREGDRVHVVDLVRQETLDQFSPSKPSPRTTEVSPPGPRKRRPR